MPCVAVENVQKSRNFKRLFFDPSQRTCPGGTFTFRRLQLLPARYSRSWEVEAMMRAPVDLKKEAIPSSTAKGGVLHVNDPLFAPIAETSERVIKQKDSRTRAEGDRRPPLVSQESDVNDRDMKVDIIQVKDELASITAAPVLRVKSGNRLARHISECSHEEKRPLMREHDTIRRAFTEDVGLSPSKRQHSFRDDVGHAAAETFLLTRLTFSLLRYLGVGYRWIVRFMALGLYALFLMPGFLQVGYQYFFSKHVHRSIKYGDQPRNRVANNVYKMSLRGPAFQLFQYAEHGYGRLDVVLNFSLLRETKVKDTRDGTAAELSILRDGINGSRSNELLVQRKDLKARCLLSGFNEPLPLTSGRCFVYVNRLDLYMPANGSTPKPVVIFVTGGAWIIGYKAWGSLLGLQFLERDIMVCCVDYRNFPQGGISDMVQDVSTGIGFITNNIDQYGGDPNRIYLAGQSAGSHLAACSLIEQARIEIGQKDGIMTWKPCQMKAFLGISGGYNLPKLVDHFHKRGLYKRIFLSVMEGETSLPLYSPELAVRSESFAEAIPMLPPMYLFHGTADVSIPHEASTNFGDALQTAGATVITKLYPEKTHTDVFLQDPMRGGYNVLFEDLVAVIHANDAEAKARDAKALPQPRLVPEFLLKLARAVSPF